MCGYCGEAYLKAAEQTANSATFQEAVGSTAFVADPNQIFDGILHDTRWASATLTYSFPTSSSAYPATYGSNQTNTFSALNSLQQTAVRDLFDDIESFTGLTFTQVGANDSSSVMRFGQTTTNTNTASGYYPSTAEEGGDTWYNSGGSYSTPILGSYAYNEGFMHEIGHALGLEHGHQNGTYGALATEYNSNEYSVMTYTDHLGDVSGGSNNEQWGNAQSYMMFDIAALQHMYGADFSASGNNWSGGSTYTFSPTTGEMFINGVGQGTPGGNRIFRTIWDGDGEDTYDLSNYTTEMLIDLRPGEWSIFDSNQLADLDGGSRDTNLARGNIANALLYQDDLRSLIENAIGGTNDDTIIGNQGVNRLEGRGGDDLLLGGIGNDHLLGGDDDDVLFGDDVVAAGSGVLVSGSSSNNYGVGSATNLDNLFSRDYNPNIDLSTLAPHVTVSATGENFAEYFKFTVLAAGTNVIIDIDNTTGGFDSNLVLQGPDGSVVAMSTSSNIGLGRYGSTTTNDSYISFDTLVAGVYTIIISDVTTGNVPTGNTFDMHVVVGGPVIGLGSPTAGHDLLDGGAGTDTVMFNSNRADVNVMSFLEGIVTSSTNDGNDRILNVENFLFLDQTVTSSTYTASNSILEYGASYGDLISAFGTNTDLLLEHYALAGLIEGRQISFSGLEYIASHADLSAVYGTDVAAGTSHYITAGSVEGREVTFNGLEYIASYSDLISIFGANDDLGANHFISAGRAEGRTELFDSRFYLGNYADLRSAYGTDIDSAASHYIQGGFNEGRSATFNGLEYIASYGDLIGAFGADATVGTNHFLGSGFAEGRGDTFDTRFYLGNYADLRSAFGTDVDAAVNHFIQAGFNEGRSADFNSLEYIASYADLIGALGSNSTAGLNHFLSAGFSEGRGDLFDASAYLNAASNADLLAAFGSDTDAATQHYIDAGFYEGRATA